ncbi:MAG: efflux RND transporter permease subunit [Candidatus Saccharimonadales bacterium]
MPKQFKISRVTAKKNISVRKLGALQRLGLYFYRRPRKTALLALVIAVFGVMSYTVLLKREGFPAMNVPIAVGQSTYFVNDPAKVDQDIAKPLSEYLATKGVIKSETNSLGNFSTIIAQYPEGVDPAAKSREAMSEIANKQVLPKGSSFKFEPAAFGVTQRGDDAVISFFSTKEPSIAETQLIEKANGLVEFLKNQNLSLVKDMSIISPIEKATNPITGQAAEVQSRFERYGERVGSETKFYSSVPVGIKMKKGEDTVKFDSQLRAAVAKYNDSNRVTGYMARVSAGFAPSIRQQISELQKTLLEGLLAVLVIGSIVIAVRASFITVLSMIMVILATLGLLELIGYTLNTITLFSLILGLSLIVDDTIIMVEALDAQRKRKNNPEEIVETAMGKVGKAMIAATSTAALSFAPLLFVGGILGSFIREIPVTIISALVISLLVALIFIPFFARFILINKKHIGAKAEHELAADFEAKVARKLSAPMLWAQHSRKKLLFVGVTAITISMLFIGASGYMFQKVKFNIFPPAKDTNQITATLRFAPGTTVAGAEAITDEAIGKIKTIIGKNFAYAANFGQANAQSATLTINLTDYNKRNVSGPAYIDKIKQEFKSFPKAEVTAASIDAGPPPSDFAARISAETNRPAAEKLASDIVQFLKTSTVERVDGSKIAFESVRLDSTDVYTRANGKSHVGLTAKFVDSDTTALVTRTKLAVTKEFTEQKVAQYGLPKDAVSFDFGQEDNNMDSFKSLVIAFPIVLAVIYLVLAVQFRSLLQPLLIFMAIPFSLFGITMGLWLTDNSFSFFAMLGFFALIGLSIKNTILLTDFANQARRAGKNPVQAAHDALAERFRPLIATSLTAIVSIIPLALASPFWQGLAVVLMFGLLSSTFLVVTVFPYYYLAGEYLRGHFRRSVIQPLRKRLQ